MSLSDFSISSPRKSRLGGEKSLTYDEDFENFLNDETSESEFSSNKFKKTAKPWWMNEDEAKASTSLASTKSFIKKPKPEVTKLKTTYESNEFEDQIDTARSQKSLSNNYSEDFDNPKDDESKQSSPSFKTRKSIERVDSLRQSSNPDFDDESSEQASSSRRSQPSVVQRKTEEKVVLEGTAPNLLSKVMFIDSLESGVLGTQTLKKIQNETETNLNNQTSKMNTQTRRDLADLEMVYRNLTTLTDSGVNTLVKTGSGNRDVQEPEQENNNPQAESFIDNSGNSEFGLQMVNVIKEELEQRVLKQVLEEFNVKKNDRKENEESGWPPSKYKHIKGTGYGSTWKSKPTRRTQLDQSTYTLKPTKNYEDKSFEIDKRFDANFEKNNLMIKNLQNQLIQCADENEKRVKEIRIEYEKQLKDLRSKLIDVTNQLNEKFTENFKKRVTFEEDSQSDDEKSKTIKTQQEKIDLLEKSLSEQDILMKGYQLENERLYDEMKKLKEQTQKQVQKIEEEKNQIKLELIQERLQGEKQPTEVRVENVAKTILPIKEETCFESDKDLQIKDLLKHNYELKQRVDFYEKNQQQIELDVKVIDQKNKEIKALNDKITKIEMNKTGPEFIREITRLKKQLQEMDLVVKRLRTSKKNDQNPVNLSLEYYEKRIEDLETKFKDKCLELERQNRMWNQKLVLYKNLRDQESGVVSRDLSPVFKKMDLEGLEKINKLEKTIVELKNVIKDYERKKHIEPKVDEKKYEKVYEPKEFMVKHNPLETEVTFDLDSMKKFYSELEHVKLKLCKSEKAL